MTAGEPTRTWERGSYRVELFDPLLKYSGSPRWFVPYRFYDRGFDSDPLFEGYMELGVRTVSDSIDVVRSVLLFTAVERTSDVEEEEELLREYTPRQRRWVEERADDLSEIWYDLEVLLGGGVNEDGDARFLWEELGPTLRTSERESLLAKYPVLAGQVAGLAIPPHPDDA